MIARIYLWISVATFLGLGIALLFWPDQILANVDLNFETPTAYADIRADYGGCIFGLGLFLGWCALRANRVKTGLLCTGLVFCGYASGRVLSLFLDGMPKRVIFILLAFEIVGALAAFALMPFVQESDSGDLSLNS